MKNSSPQSFSELEVNDFGPIVRAKIDLRPLTVFVGPSNTGKSYLAILLYALHRFFGLDAHTAIQGAALSSTEGVTSKLSGEARDDLVKWAELTAAGRPGSPDERNVSVPSRVADTVRSVFRGFNKLGDSIGSELDRCFELGGETGKLVRKGSGEARVVFRKPLPDDSEKLSHVLTIDSRGTGLSVDLDENAPMRLDSGSVGKLPDLAMFPASSMTDLSEKECLKLVIDLAAVHLPEVFGPLHLPAFYLPADRGGVMSTHKAFIQGLISSASTGQRPDPVTSGVITDFLRQLFSIEPNGKRRGASRSDLVERIENRVLGGSVRVGRSAAGFPVFTYRPEGWKADMPLTNASSMVSELAPVALYLRHIVLPENVLIVEEPESHLHPAMQVEFARQIAAVVNSGVRVMITTHSEWLLEELANLVRLSKLSKSARKKIDKDDVALRPDQVGAWLFERKRRPKGSVVKEIPLDEESGLFPTDFDDVAVALHNKWADISSGMEQKR